MIAITYATALGTRRGGKWRSFSPYFLPFLISAPHPTPMVPLVLPLPIFGTHCACSILNNYIFLQLVIFLPQSECLRPESNWGEIEKMTMHLCCYFAFSHTMFWFCCWEILESWFIIRPQVLDFCKFLKTWLCDWSWALSMQRAISWLY